MGGGPPKKPGYARGTQVSTTETNRETFGGNSKAGLGRSIGLNQWTYGAVVNGTSGHGAPLYTGMSFMKAFEAGKIASSEYPVSITNQLSQTGSRYGMTRTPADGVNLEQRKEMQNKVNESLGDDDEGLGPNEYDYIIIGTGAGAAGVLLGLLEYGTGNEKILVLEKGNANVYTFDNEFNNGYGYSKFEDGAGIKAINNKTVKSFISQTETINVKVGSTFFPLDFDYPILSGNVLGGNTYNNGGFWHHQPVETIFLNPPNNLNNFDLNTWEQITQLTTKKLTNYERGEYYGDSVNANTSVIGSSRLNIFQKFKNFLKTTFASMFGENFFKTANINIPFADSNLQNGTSKVSFTTVLLSENFDDPTSIVGKTRNAAICPLIMRVFQDHKIKINSAKTELNNDKVKVLLNSEVEKIILNSDYSKATGVLVNGTQYTSTKKIFVCCGAFSTPSLLAKSNLGKDDWYQGGNIYNPNTTLQSRLNNMGKLWQTPDYTFFLLPMKIDFSNPNKGIQWFSYDGNNVNSQYILLNNANISVNTNTVPNYWNLVYELVRQGLKPIGFPQDTNVQESYYEYLRITDSARLWAFDGTIPLVEKYGYTSIKNYMEKNPDDFTSVYSYDIDTIIGIVRDGIANQDITQANISGLNLLLQYRVNNNFEYPGGALDFPKKNNFDLTDISANFGWTNLQTNTSFVKSVQEGFKQYREKVIPAVYESDQAFSNFSDIINFSIQTENFTLLLFTTMALYSTSFSSVQGTYGVDILDPDEITLPNGTTINVYTDEQSRINTTTFDVPLNFKSGWHYTGTASNISDPNTGEVVPGLMIADGAAFNGPVRNNSMAAISAIGGYMAKLAIDQN